MASHREAFCRLRTLRNTAGTLLTVTVLLTAGLESHALAQALRQPPNSHVAIAVGQSFTASTRFMGFLDEASGASYIIAEMPASAYEEVKKLADRPEALASNGIVDTQRGTLSGRSGEYVYVTGTQRTPSENFAKFLLIMREGGYTVMITANIPQTALDARSVTREQVERTLASATVRRDGAKSIELFKLGYLGPFKEVRSITALTRAYTLTGLLPERGDGGTAPEPQFVISPSLHKEQLVDVRAATLKSFQTLGGYEDRVAVSESEMTVGALQAYGVIGHGVDKKSGEKSSLYVATVAGQAGGYYVLVGTCPEGNAAYYLQEFQKMVMSFRPVRQ